MNYCETTNVMKISSGDGVLQRKYPLFLFIGIFSWTNIQTQYKHSTNTAQIQYKYSTNTVQIEYKYSTNTAQIQY